MGRQATSEQEVFVSSAPAGNSDRRLALSIVIISILIFVVLAPFARHPLPKAWAFIPIYESALAINDFVTAVLLFGQFNILRSRALLLLAAGYLFNALFMIPHALTFPGLFAPTGLLDAGPQSTAWLYMFWHGVFPIAVISYALFKNRHDAAIRPHGSARPALMLTALAVIAAVAALTLLATAGNALLPIIMHGSNTTLAMVVVVLIICVLCLAAILLIWLQRPHSILDLWLMVVMCAWMLDVTLSAGLNGARFDLGFYAGRVYGFLAATIVLMVLLLETGALHAQLLILFAAEQQERKQEAEERRRIVETSLDLILVVDRKGNFLRVSPSSLAILGYEASEMTGHNAVEFLFPDDLDAIRGQMRGARRGRLIRNFPTRYFHKDGRLMTLAWSGVWSEPEQRYFFIGRDVTEQKRVERMKEEFIATVSHELRTPVTSIMGPLGLLMGGAAGELPDPAKRLVAMAQANSTRLAKLVNDILDIGDIETGTMTFDLRRVDLKPLLEQAIGSYRITAEKLNVSMRLELSAGEFPARTDADRLKSVITKLLSNAVKFSPPNKSVIVSVEPRDECLRITVRDHGPGIPDEVKAHLFEKFIRGDATDTRQKDGTGLGLSIVKAAMIRLQGDVGCNAAPTGGTIFHIDVPRWPAQSATELAPRTSIEAA